MHFIICVAYVPMYTIKHDFWSYYSDHMLWLVVTRISYVAIYVFKAVTVYYVYIYV